MFQHHINYRMFTAQQVKHASEVEKCPLAVLLPLSGGSSRQAVEKNI
jgi:hypothetical protein